MRTLFLTVALLAFGPVESAYNVCGCSSGGNNLGIFYSDALISNLFARIWAEGESRSTHV